MRTELELKTSALDLVKVVTFHGALPHQKVKDMLRDAAVFVLPSVTASSDDVEGIPVALMEAMMAGVVVASTRLQEFRN